MASGFLLTSDFCKRKQKAKAKNWLEKMSLTRFVSLDKNEEEEQI